MLLLPGSWWHSAWHAWVSTGLLGCAPVSVIMCVCVCVCERARVMTEGKSRAIPPRGCGVNIPRVAVPLPVSFIVPVCLLVCVSAFVISKFARLSVCLCFCPPSRLHICTPPSQSARLICPCGCSAFLSLFSHFVQFCWASARIQYGCFACLHAFLPLTLPSAYRFARTLAELELLFSPSF